MSSAIRDIPPELLYQIVSWSVGKHLDDLVAGAHALPLFNGYGDPEDEDRVRHLEDGLDELCRRWLTSEDGYRAPNPISALLRTSSSVRAITLEILSKALGIPQTQSTTGSIQSLHPRRTTVRVRRILQAGTKLHSRRVPVNVRFLLVHIQKTYSACNLRLHAPSHDGRPEYTSLMVLYAAMGVLRALVQRPWSVENQASVRAECDRTLAFLRKAVTPGGSGALQTPWAVYGMVTGEGPVSMRISDEAWIVPALQRARKTVVMYDQYGHVVDLVHKTLKKHLRAGFQSFVNSEIDWEHSSFPSTVFEHMYNLFHACKDVFAFIFLMSEDPDYRIFANNPSFRRHLERLLLSVGCIPFPRSTIHKYIFDICHISILILNSLSVPRLSVVAYPRRGSSRERAMAKSANAGQGEDTRVGQDRNVRAEQDGGVDAGPALWEHARAMAIVMEAVRLVKLIKPMSDFVCRRE